MAVAQLHALEEQVADRTADLVRALDREIELLRDRRDRLSREITDLVNKRRLYSAHASGTGRMPRGLRRVSKPDGILAILREVAPRAMPLREIHEEMVRRGWSIDTRRERHALEVAVRALDNRG